jgi:hypothetical protein
MYARVCVPVGSMGGRTASVRVCACMPWRRAVAQYSSDLWRCYNPAFYGGKSMEAGDVDLEGKAHYWRAQYPGQPFRKNDFDNNDNELPICTPALTNAATRVAWSGPVAVVVAAAAAVVLAWRGRP